MKHITIVTKDKVGLIADVSYILGSARINIETLSAEVHGGTSIVNIAVKDEKRATELLKSNGYDVLESELLVVKIKDEPTQMAAFTSKLLGDKINILSMHQLAKDGQFDTFAVKVDHPAKAKRMLGDYLVECCSQK
jgi:hypothetical protein